ncbi:hypothetical protein EYF80_027038 [Liparis tanakae]|uniref:Uncharacterized protein n=1 Tax=Liparis tanakae TaxID=230148 RepID=A0A4Z2HAA9_9TELE|nr:hypothetical protein EYF80_027038 [Liparis tanakae]
MSTMVSFSFTPFSSMSTVCLRSVRKRQLTRVDFPRPDSPSRGKGTRIRRLQGLFEEDEEG